jgi:hypothetical protein
VVGGFHHNLIQAESGFVEIEGDFDKSYIGLIEIERDYPGLRLGHHDASAGWIEHRAAVAATVVRAPRLGKCSQNKVVGEPQITQISQIGFRSEHDFPG